MKTSSVTDQHITFALALLEQVIISNERASSELNPELNPELNSSASSGSGLGVHLGIPQRALLHSALLQSELAMKSFLEELHGFQSISVSALDRYFQESIYRASPLSQALIALENMFDALFIQGSTFTELFVLRKRQDSWLFYLEQGLNSLGYTKAEWDERFNKPLAPSKTIDASNLIASSSVADSLNEQSLNTLRYWSDLNPNDLRAHLLAFRIWARSIRSNMDEY